METDQNFGIYSEGLVFYPRDWGVPRLQPVRDAMPASDPLLPAPRLSLGRWIRPGGRAARDWSLCLAGSTPAPSKARCPVGSRSAAIQRLESSGPQHPRHLDSEREPCLASTPLVKTSRASLGKSPLTRYPQPERAGAGPYRVAAVELSAFGQTGLGLGSALHLLHDTLDVASGDSVEEHGWGAERTRIVFGSAPHYFHKHTPGALSSFE